MTINERLRYFRKEVLKMNQTDFASAIGMKQTGLSYIEKDGATIKEQVFKSICMAFNLNEYWLRNGTEPMYIQAPTFSLDDFVRQRGGTELEIDIMKAYFELEPDTRAMLIQHFKERLTASRDEPSEMTVEEAEAAYIKSRSKIARKAGSSALNTTADTEPGSENGNSLVSNQ